MTSHRRIAPILPAIAALLAGAALLAPASAPALELAQNAPITTTPGVVSPPAAVLPDLRAQTIKTEMRCMKTGDVLTLTVKVSNQNKTDADLTKVPFYHVVTARLAKANGDHQLIPPLIQDHMATSAGTGPAVLKGETSFVTKIVLTTVVRTHLVHYRFEVIVDPDNLVPESNENNLSIADVLNVCKP